MDIITVSPWIRLWKWTSGETGVEKKATPHLSPMVISWGTRDLELQESKHTPKAKAPDVCATQYSLQTGHIIWASQPPNQLSRTHVYSSFHRSGNRFRFPTHPRWQSTNLSLKFHIQWPFLQTHTVLSLRQPRLECSKEAETRLCSRTSLMGRGDSLQKGGPPGGIMNYSTAFFFSISHSILEDSPGCSGFPWAPRLSDESA